MSNGVHKAEFSDSNSFQRNAIRNYDLSIILLDVRIKRAKINKDSRVKRRADAFPHFASGDVVQSGRAYITVVSRLKIAIPMLRQLGYFLRTF